MIAADQPFRRDISIFRQRGGSTFRAAGKHRVQVAFRFAPGRVVLSNVVECKVLRAEPTSEAWRLGHEILTSCEARRLLRSKAISPTPYSYKRLTHFAKSYASKATAAAIDYALGKALLRTVDSTANGSQKLRQLRSLALKHLDGASRNEALGAYRRQVIDGMAVKKVPKRKRTRV